MDRTNLSFFYANMQRGYNIVDKDKLQYFVKLLALIGNYIITAENKLFLQKKDHKEKQGTLQKGK